MIEAADCLGGAILAPPRHTRNPVEMNRCLIRLHRATRDAEVDMVVFVVSDP